MIIFEDGSQVVQIPISSVWITFGVVMGIYVAFYVLRAIGLYTMAKKADNKYALLSCFPVVWIYIVACLCGPTNTFGKNSDKFPIFAVLFCGLVEIITITISLMSFVPLFGYVVCGGDLIITTDLTPYSGTSFWAWRVGGFYFVASNFLSPYSEGVWKALDVLNTIFGILSLFAVFVYVLVYSNFFRRYFPNHYFVATLFSVLGFFGPFAFAIRNNTPVNYVEYMRERYNEFYGQNADFTRRPPQDDFTSQNKTENNGEDPFKEYQEKTSDKKDDSDPFDEF